MKTTTASEWTMIVPKRRKRHYSYDESVDEPAKLIKDEPMEVEEEIPAEENQPVERIEENNGSDSSAVEE
jgi:hypothetical protein